MAVYVSESDETGAAKQDGKFIVAGYVANELAWPDFSQTWAETILLPEPKIPYIHMTEIRGAKFREKYGISRAEADERILKAVELVSGDAPIQPYFGQISEKAYLDCKEKLRKAGIQSQKHHDDIDYVCFIAYALHVTNTIYHEKKDAERVTFHISNKKFVSENIQRWLYGEMAKGLKETIPHLGNIFGDIVPLNWKDHMPLQAADVLCWHLQRAYAFHGKGEPDPEVNKAFEIIRKKEIIPVNVKDEYLEELADGLIRSYAEANENDEHPQQ